MNTKIYWIIISVLLAVIIGILVLGKKNYVNKSLYEYLDARNVVLEQQIKGDSIQKAILLDMVVINEKKKDSILIENNALEQRNTFLMVEYQKLKIVLLDGANDSTTTIGDVFDICDEVIKVKDGLIKNLKAINIENEEIITTLHQVIKRDEFTNIALREQVDNYKIMLAVSEEESKDLRKQIRRQKAQKYIVKGIAIAGITYLLIK